MLILNLQRLDVFIYSNGGYFDSVIHPGTSFFVDHTECEETIPCHVNFSQGNHVQTVDECLQRPHVLASLSDM